MNISDLISSVEGDAEFQEIIHEIMEVKVFHVESQCDYLIMRLKEYLEKSLDDEDLYEQT